jgi:ABC-type lipoprotein export system ATPase subunit
MDFKALKLELVRQILATESKDLLDKLLSTLKKEDKDFWSELSADQKNEVEIARKQIENGEFEEWETVFKRLTKKSA